MKQFVNHTEQNQSIKKLRSNLGDQLSILGHHYQEQSVIDHCDYTGDSLELSQKITHLDAKHIIFCGVFFMAEPAALLAHNNQHIYIPEPSANCMMSLMSPAQLLDKIFEKLTKSGRKIIPIAYVNTTLEVKAVVGKYGGSLCTSSSAKKVLSWAIKGVHGANRLASTSLLEAILWSYSAGKTISHHITKGEKVTKQIINHIPGWNTNGNGINYKTTFVNRVGNPCIKLCGMM